MSVIFSALTSLRRRRLRAVTRALDRAVYWALYSLTPARRLAFFNSGYAPLSPHLLQVPSLAGEPYQAMLFELVLRGHLEGLDQPPPREVLEIGAGLGGGVLYARAAFPHARIVGVDVNPAAVSAARRRAGRLAGVELKVASGAALPFPDCRFDRIVSVGTAGYVGIELFLAEAARVLSPGGAISMSTGFTDATWPGIVALIDRLSAEQALDVLRLTDITPNTLAALDADSPRRERLIRHVPPPFRSYAREMADLPGTERHQRYASGRRIDFAAVLRKPAQRGIRGGPGMSPAPPLADH